MRSPKVTVPTAFTALGLVVAGALLPPFASAKPEQTDSRRAASTLPGSKDAPAVPGDKALSSRRFTKPYGSHLGPILDRIQANPGQRHQITVIVESFRSTLEPLMDKYKEKQQEFIQSMTSGASDETIMASQVELTHLASQISANYMLMRLQVRHLLTPPQIVELEVYRHEHGWTQAQ